MLLMTGGDSGPGLGLELFPLALLELCLLLLVRYRARWKLMRLAAAGDGPPIQSLPGLWKVPGAKGFKPPPILLTCGVVVIIMLSLSPSIGSSSSSLLVVSESSMFTLETELEMVVRSAGPEVEKGWAAPVLGDARPDDVAPPRRCGIVRPRPPMVGDESGEDSARVE